MLSKGSGGAVTYEGCVLFTVLCSAIVDCMVKEMQGSVDI